MSKHSKIKGQKLSARELERAIYKHLKANDRKQYNPKQILQKIKVDNSIDAVQSAIGALVKAARIVPTDNHKYQLNKSFEQEKSSKYLEGRVDMTRSGAAYIIVDGQEDDIFVSPNRTGTAQNGDTVKIRTWTARGRRKPEGEVVEVIKRSVDHFVGTLHLFNRIAVVTMDGGAQLDVVIPPDKTRSAENGEKVVVKITNWESDRNGALSGEITAILGKPGSSNIEMQAILINNGFNIAFPEEVVLESEALPSHISQEEIAKRRDMREVTTFTIDPLTAKDFDDALSIQHLEDGRIEVGIHIADVSHYVRPNSALDQEAARRSTSVYLVDRVCPMLPEKISNELCSLRPNEDKLSFSAVFEFNPKTLQIEKRWFGRTVIHSDRRFTYEEAQDILDEGKGELHSELAELKKIGDKLRERRFKEGSIDFASDEVRFELDEQGKPLRVYVKKTIDTNRLIEDFMLLANREVATYMVQKAASANTNIPFVFRVHDEPDPEKVEELAKFAAVLGVKIDRKSPATIARSYNYLMQLAEKDASVKMLAPLAIRTMAKAIYTTQNIGHYGLGFENYTHFTSPIRRYADVLAHRILDKNLQKGAPFTANPVKLEENCKHISNQERKATTAERESIKYKQVEFIQDHVGEEFDGIINGIADFGVFVELSDNYVEGMIAFQNMDEGYQLDSNKLTMTGSKTGKVVSMGDQVRVRILEADLSRRRVELALVSVTEKEGASRAKTNSSATDNKSASPRRSGPPKRSSSRSSRQPRQKKN